MSLKLKCIAALAFIVELFVLSSTAQLNIERGYRDTFDNPNCDSLTQNACNCDNLNAHCVDSVNSTCKRCRCSPAYATFLSSNGKSGKCVKNRHLLFIPAFSSSFLAQNIKCLVSTKLNELKGETCNDSEKKQRWIWTPNNQLMHVDTLKCLQLGEQDEKGNLYWRIVLKECNHSKGKQLWKCKGQQGQIETSKGIKLYMAKEHLVWGTTYNIQNRTQTTWTRYRSSGKNLCSKASGCYGFWDPAQSAIWEIDCLQKSCQGDNKIATPAKLRENNLCFIMWKKLQYLDNDKWKQLIFKDEIFTIENRNDETSLKLNFKEATNYWSGLIVKLHFYCANKKLIRLNTTDINCIVIKFKGTAIYSPTLLSTISTADTRIIPNYSTTSTSLASSTDTLLHLDRAPQNNKSDSSHVTIIALCVVIAVLILGAGILGLIFYKQRRRPSANKEVESNEPTEDITNPIYATIDIYETLPFSGVDEIYQEPYTGPEPGECKVHESIDDKYRDHADVEQNDKRPALQEHAQEDAKGVDVHPVAQRMPVKDQLPDYLRDAQSEEKVLNSKDEQNNDQCHVYHTLEELKFDG